jgi:hypothetical protein
VSLTPPVVAAAVLPFEELLLPPQAARPIAASATTATVSSGACLRIIFGPLSCVGPNLASSTSPPPPEIA